MPAQGILTLLVGLAVYPVIVAGFILRLDVPIFDAFLAGILIELMPVMALIQVPLADAQKLERLAAYRSSAVVIAVLAGASLASSTVGSEFGRLGLGPVSFADLAVASGWLLLACGVLVAVFHLVGRVFDLDESELTIAMLPRSGRERWAFAGLSIVAGVGEEIAFRGFLIAVLTPALGSPWSALVVSSVAFGVLHAYQGAIGFARAGLLGMLFASSFLMSGGLWPAIVVHTVLDWVGGLWWGPKMWPASDVE